MNPRNKVSHEHNSHDGERGRRFGTQQSCDPRSHAYSLAHKHGMRRSRRSFIPNPRLILAIPGISRICPSPSQYLCGSDASNGLQGLAGWYLGGLPIPWSGPCASRHGTQAPLPADAPLSSPRSVCPSFRRLPPPLSSVPSIASLAAANPSGWCSPNSVSEPSTHSLGPTCRGATAPVTADQGHRCGISHTAVDLSQIRPQPR